MSAVELFAFDSHEVRVVTVCGEPWFVLADLCAALSLTNPSAVAGRVRDALGDAALSLAEVSSGGQRRQVTIVSESGMYEVVIRSDKQEAARFRRWVTSEVLPSIRKTGAYGASSFDPTSVEGAIALVQAAQTALAALAVAQPKADAWDELAGAAGDYSVAEAAKVLARAGIVTGPRRLFDALERLGWLFRRGGHWVAYQERIDSGLLAHRAQSHEHPRTGDRVVDAPQVRVTVRGLERLRSLLQGPLELDVLSA